MQNPALYEYRRTIKLAALFVLMLSFAAALCHFLLTIDNRLQHTEQRLQFKAAQIDTQLQPLLNLLNWLTKLPFSEQAALQSTLALKLHNRQGEPLNTTELVEKTDSVASELLLLQHLDLAFTAIELMQPALERIVYVSEQHFIYANPQTQLTATLANLVPWFEQYEQAEGSAKPGLATLALSKNKVLLSQRIQQPNGGAGYILFVLDVPLLLMPLQQQTPGADFLLLDEHGHMLGGTTKDDSKVDEMLLQLQRIGRQPFSLAMLEARNGLFSAGFKSFIAYWIGYLVVLSLATLGYAYRYKQKVVGPVRRLTVHVERAIRDQGSVRHIPSGWEEIFDKISRLKS
ncbi:hypothetical protein LMJ53_15255 [Rheinheimera sp. UJ51]|uniref:hypothetical protein n=1 Tax=Rheinheimera sp. UJ51 TaxID=2892446 RepID=UPI001E336F9B|nr:hypothetical protein [Rheinheimera sp. UJ51]MCC5453079.1 hypothetical protein [Rheinheimera sp. UJ51]